MEIQSDREENRKKQKVKLHVRFSESSVFLCSVITTALTKCLCHFTHNGYVEAGVGGVVEHFAGSPTLLTLVDELESVFVGIRVILDLGKRCGPRRC